MSTTDRVDYGTHASQFAHRWIPAGEPRGAVLLIHGGWWRQRHDLHLMDALASDLRDRGHLVWNLEYRRIDADAADGGWPRTLHDVRDAVALLLDTENLEAGQVVAVGHSAGGQLALLAAVGVELAGVVALAPITDLPRCALAGLGEGATPIFMGATPEEDPDGYRAASPVDRLPLHRAQLVVHGTDDGRVPIAHSRDYVRRARELGDAGALREITGGDHMFVLDPTHGYWPDTADWIARRITDR